MQLMRSQFVFFQLGTLGVTLVLWIVFYRRLVPLAVPEIACGEYMKYANGVKYRM